MIFYFIPVYAQSDRVRGTHLAHFHEHESNWRWIHATDQELIANYKHQALTEECEIIYYSLYERKGGGYQRICELGKQTDRLVKKDKARARRVLVRLMVSVEADPSEFLTVYNIQKFLLSGPLTTMFPEYSRHFHTIRGIYE